jgi:type I restriction enzyme, R subunit
MPKPSEHKTIQSRLLRYAQEIGWTFVTQSEAERRRHFDRDAPSPKEAARRASLFFDDLLYAKVRELNPKYKEAEGALVGDFSRLHADVYGNREFLNHLRNQGKFFCTDEGRELDLVLIDYADLEREPGSRRNIYEVMEEFTVNNGRYCNREDVVFLINGIPVLVVECKNATKSEAIAIAIDQIRRYHSETPEMMVPEMMFTATDSLGFDYGLEHGASQHLQVEARGHRQPRSRGEDFLCYSAGAPASQRLHPLCGKGRRAREVYLATAPDRRC